MRDPFKMDIMNTWLKRLAHGGLDLLFPPVCQVCNTSTLEGDSTSICRACLSELQPLSGPLCPCCGRELYSSDEKDHLCGDCLKTPPPFSIARSLFSYDDGMRVLIPKFKYQKDTSLIHVFSELIFCFDLSDFMFCDYIAPVPLHRKRLQHRGFNQALLLAEAIFGRRDERITPSLLARTVHTVPQVSLEGAARRKSLVNVFKVDPKIDISGRTICVIDDVYTTGTTVSECSRALMGAGAGKVVVLTLARVKVPRGGR